MPIHSHDFVETEDFMPAFGLNRQTDEKTVIYYLQKFSDDSLMNTLIKRFSNDDLEEIYFLVNRVLKTHLSENEYHSLFLKDPNHK